MTSNWTPHSRRQRNQSFGMLCQRRKRDHGLVVHALKDGLRHDLTEVVVAHLVLDQEQQVIAPFGPRSVSLDSSRTQIPAPKTGCMSAFLQALSKATAP